MISIDVGSKKVAVVEGSCKAGQVTVSAYGEIEYESELVVNGAITDRAQLGFLINEIIKTNYMKSKNAAVSIYSSEIISREFKLPNVKMQSLKALAHNEMKRLVGEETNFMIDFVVRGLTEDNMLSVNAYAVTRDIVDEYYKLLKELKLKPAVLDIQDNSISKLLSKTTINETELSEGNIIVADIGFSKISFHGFSEGRCHFNRTDLSPMLEFVREMGSVNRIDITKADLEKLDLSPDAHHDSLIVADTCKYFIYRLSEEIQRYLQYIAMNSENKTVSKVFICGGASSLKGIDLSLSEMLNVPIEIINNIGRLHAKGFPVSQICNAAGALIK